MPSLQGLDPDGRVIYVGSFSKSLFPAMRLGYVIVPGDLAAAFVGARRASDLHSPMLEQAVLAEFMADGSFERHLRRMRSEYRRRLAALIQAAARHGDGLLTLRPVTTGLHAVADLDADVDDEAVCREARRRGVEVMPLSFYAFDRRRKPARGLVLGFAAVPGHLFDEGMARVAAAIRAVTEPRRVA
jgi:GntR family transcriptional regulator/MocR family aminotransferase